MPNIKPLKIICLCSTLWFIAFSLQTENAFSLSRYQLQIQIQQADDLPIAAASVGLFNAKGIKIGPKQKTDAEGVAGFYVPEGIYTARITYLKSDFWSPPYEGSHHLSARCIIPHKKITIKVQGRFQKRVPLPGVKVELYSKDGQGSGQKKRHDSLGQVAFAVPERPFEVRVRYRKQHFWSEVFIWQNQAVTIPMGHAGIHQREDERISSPHGMGAYYAHTYDYNPQGQLLNINGPKVGSDDTAHFTNDQLNGDLLSVSMPFIGALAFSEYEAAGKAHLLTDVNGQSKRLEYDARGRCPAITHTADDSTSATTYNAAGFIETISDQDQVTYGYSYDEILGRLASIRDTQGNTITFKYDEQGNLTEKNTLTNAGALVGLKRWSFQHPDFPGRLWKEIQSDGSDAVCEE